VTEWSGNYVTVDTRPTEVAKVPSLPAAKSRALARTALGGAASLTTSLAKTATSVGSDAGCQRAMTRATSLEVTLYIY